jgi:hypothetical protein
MQRPVTFQGNRSIETLTTARPCLLSSPNAAVLSRGTATLWMEAGWNGEAKPLCYAPLVPPTWLPTMMPVRAKPAALLVSLLLIATISRGADGELTPVLDMYD